MMTDVTGASVPDQALVSDGAPADRHPSGFDPSRVDRDWHGQPVEDFSAWVWGMVADQRASFPYCDSDRNPEGEDAQRLSAEHESAGRNGIAQPSVGESAQ